MNINNQKKGFTLIEIVLVLAIAGLLLVIVFLAVSGAQKSRRDSQRKNDLSRLAASIENYASNTNGNYPDSPLTSGTFASYVPSNFNDPSSSSNYMTIGSGTPGNVTYSRGTGTACDNTPVTGGRQYVVRMQLEEGEACRDNK